MTIIDHAGRSGLLAFGDSITNGGGELQWGVALQSWALWAARGLGLPYTPYAVDGATAADVVRRQIPLHGCVDANPDARYALGCLYIGVNDVRAFDWDAASFEADLRVAVTYLADRCRRVLCVTIPRDLGRPRAGAKVLEANEVIRRVGSEAAAVILDLSDFGARNLLMADHVHPTALGQLYIAERALDVLAADGMRVAVRPSTRIHFETTRWRRLRGDLTYTYRHAKTTARELCVRLAARTL